ncbi:YiiX/YebB-like N1pC/P60 family cysteine hydrolase [Citrobacter freundii]
MLDRERLRPGDIILERGYEWYSEEITKRTNSNYSHAMIYVGGTIMEATLAGGVFSRIPNRSAVRNIDDFKVLRLKEYPGSETINTICERARYLTGSQYSLAEALLVKGPDTVKAFKADSRKQFCSRLVVQCYLAANIELVNDPRFCSPADIERSELLEVIPHTVYEASESEVAHVKGPSAHSQHSADTVNYVKTALDVLKSYGVKTIGSSDGEIVVTTLSDITTAVYENRNAPGLDEQMTEVMVSSGYLSHIENDRMNNPFRYDPILFKDTVEKAANGDLHELTEILRVELNKELKVIDSRIKYYQAARWNLKSGLSFSQAEFRIPNGLLKAMLERLLVIDKYLESKKGLLDVGDMNTYCKAAIQKIVTAAPEL